MMEYTEINLRMPRIHDLESTINRKSTSSFEKENEICTKCEKLHIKEDEEFDLIASNNDCNNHVNFDDIAASNANDKSVRSTLNLDEIIISRYCNCTAAQASNANKTDVNSETVSHIHTDSHKDETTTSDGRHQEISYYQDVNVKDHYDFYEELGKGKFGTVYRVELKQLDCSNVTANKLSYAAKQLTYRSEQSKQRIVNEIEMMKNLTNGNQYILSLIGVYECATSRPKNITLIMELLSGGELFEELTKNEYLTETKVVNILRQIISGVDYIHSHEIIHRDLKPENIVYSHNNSELVKIIDFGLAVKYNAKSPPKEMVGTTIFAAPEVFRFEAQSYHTDMWSIGVLAYNLLAGITPFEIPMSGDRYRQLDENEIIKNIECCMYDFDDEGFEGVSEYAKQFISSLLIRQQHKRLNAKQCMKHLWLSCDENDIKSESPNLNQGLVTLKRMKKYLSLKKWKKVTLAIRSVNNFKEVISNK